MSEIELRVITPGQYWTVYRGKRYLGAIDYYGSRVFRAISDGYVIGTGENLDEVTGLFNHIGEPG